MRLFLIIFLGLGEIATSEPDPIVSNYIHLYHATFKRILDLENRIDGLDDKTRDFIADRKLKHSTKKSDKGILLNEPALLHAVITERKRLERESKLIDEIGKSKTLSKQLEKKIATDYLALEITNIIVLYTEYLSDFLSGKRKHPPGADLETIKILAATLTGLHFSKEKKRELAFFNETVLKHSPRDSGTLLKSIYQSIGEVDKDFFESPPPHLSKEATVLFETERLNKTRTLRETIEYLSQTLLISNKALWDEYQYNVLRASKKTQ